jgi:hypothetical protein
MKRNVYATQGRCLIGALKTKPHTYMQMLAHGISTSPWRRVLESLREDEQLLKTTGKDGLVRWRVVRAPAR